MVRRYCANPITHTIAINDHRAIINAISRTLARTITYTHSLTIDRTHTRANTNPRAFANANT
jgi:hypothetical protein